MEQVLIVSAIFLCIYKVVEVFVHRRERLNLVEKIDSLKDHNVNISQILGESDNFSGAFKWGCLLIGLGVGILVAYTIISALDLYDDQSIVIYTSCVFIFGGIGLLVSYFLEKKKINKK